MRRWCIVRTVTHTEYVDGEKTSMEWTEYLYFGPYLLWHRNPSSATWFKSYAQAEKKIEHVVATMILMGQDAKADSLLIDYKIVRSPKMMTRDYRREPRKTFRYGRRWPFRTVR